MPALKNLPLFFIFLVCFGATSLAVFYLPFVPAFDQFIYQNMGSFASPSWLAANRIISFLGKSEFFIPISFFLFLVLITKKKSLEGFVYFFTIITAVLANSVLKHLFLSPRPISFEDYDRVLSPAYPSGHAAGSIVFYLLSFLLFSKIFPRSIKRWMLFPTLILIFLIGFSRIALGAHWFSDVMGGYFFGLAWVTLGLFVLEKSKSRQDELTKIVLHS